MKKRKFLIQILFIMLFSLPALAQVSVLTGEESGLKAYPIDASSVLWRMEQKVAQDYKDHPEIYAKNQLSKTNGWNFTIGSQKIWYSVDFTNGNALYATQSTCRAVGDKCYIFVEDSLWGTRVTQKAVDSVRIYFDSKTPANANKGIYQTNVEFFGEPPDIDNDPKIIIHILNIRDGWNGRDVTGYIQGFFTSYNEMTGPSYPNSNAAEIYFLDAYPLNLTASAGLLEGSSVTAHEFQHMIHWNYKHGNNTTEATFLNEGCSLIAEVNCGFTVESQSRFVKETNHYLFDWRPTSDIDNLNDYSRSARFHLYIRDQFGIAAFKNLVQGLNTGFSAYTDAFQKAGSSLTFNEVFQNWAVANILDDTTVSKVYGYKYPNLLKATGTINFNPNIPLQMDNLQYVTKLGAQYLIYQKGKNLKITFSSVGSNIKIRAVEKGNSGNKVVDITPNVEFAEPEYGTKYSEIDFVLTNTDRTNLQQQFNYTSSGTVNLLELKYDESEPVGVLPGVDQDTIGVLFNGVPGGKLDSIRVALRGIGSIQGGVWSYSGAPIPGTKTPLGKRLAGPFRANNSVSERPAVPYPVPWQNWGTVNLKNLNIDASNAFCVAFVDSSSYVSAPYPQRVMVTTKTGVSYLYSFSSQIDAQTDATTWYFPYNTTNNVTYQYLIRAYVSFEQNGVKETIELQPKQVTLAQNYPNPFNPTTNIEFSLPKSEFVTLKVFNVLGEEITTIVSGNLTAGKYKYNWNAKGMTSGIYFYTLKAGQFNETKKFMLVK
jgi:hypothetical protein